jgi:hypothetical protein
LARDSKVSIFLHSTIYRQLPCKLSLPLEIIIGIDSVLVSCRLSAVHVHCCSSAISTDSDRKDSFASTSSLSPLHRLLSDFGGSRTPYILRFPPRPVLASSLHHSKLYRLQHRNSKFSPITDTHLAPISTLAKSVSTRLQCSISLYRRSASPRTSH